MTAAIASLVLGTVFGLLLAVQFRLGSVGARGGVIHRSECPVGYWITLSAQTVGGLGIMAIAAIL